MDNNWEPSQQQLPPTVPPSSLSLERQCYLHNTIRMYCPEEVQDEVCPLPLTPPSHSTTSASSAATPASSTATGRRQSTSGGGATETTTTTLPPPSKASTHLWQVSHGRPQCPHLWKVETLSPSYFLLSLSIFPILAHTIYYR